MRVYYYTHLKKELHWHNIFSWMFSLSTLIFRILKNYKFKKENIFEIKILYNKTNSPKVCRSITAEPLDGIQWKLSHWIVLSLNHKNMPFNHLICIWRDIGKWNALSFCNSCVLQNSLFWFNLTKFLQFGEKCALVQNICIAFFPGGAGDSKNASPVFDRVFC